ncbi:MAG TPA: type II secretion system protein [Bacilli bacterium]
MTIMKKLKNQMGLTLIELLAVVVILGVIAAIAVPAIGGTIQNSKVKADAQAEELIKDAAVRYLIDTDPSNATTIVSPATTATINVSTLQTAGYLKSIPKKQQLATPVVYATVTVSYSLTGGWSATAIAT